MDDDAPKPGWTGCLLVLALVGALSCAGLISASLWIVHLAMGD